MIKLCETDSEIAECFSVFKDLHEDLTLSAYLPKVKQMRRSGYQVTALFSGDQAVSVAGFHLGESFAWGRYLYIDDMVTKSEFRSQGYGERVLGWIRDYACAEQIQQIHLDSRVIRHEAHKFYINQGFIQGGYHFHMYLEEGKA